MRVFETAHDHCVLPGIHMVARIDGRSFSQLTRVTHALEAPYDERFRDWMIAAMRHAMGCGFSVVYGYTQSDEISLLLHRNERLFGRKLRKLNSVLAGETSAAFSLALGAPAAFDCRVSQLPTEDDVVDYFRWRHEDAHRNALNGHCYWLLRRQGASDAEATRRLEGVSIAARNELLFQHGIQFNEIPNWQKRGVGAYWERVEQPVTDPRTGEARHRTKKRLVIDLELPMKEAYEAFVRGLLNDARGDGAARPGR